MSSSSGSDSGFNQEVYAFYNSVINSTYCQLAAATLIFYEYLTSLSEEVELIWGRKLTGATVTFFLNRYILLIYGISVILGTLDWKTSLSCEATLLFYYITQILLYCLTAAFSALRAYAISDYKWHTAVIVFILGIVPVGTNLYIDIRESYAYVIYVGTLPSCTETVYYTPTTRNILVIVTRICSVISDMIVLVVTWYHTYTVYKSARAANMKTSLGAIILRDGTFYFITLLLLNVIQMIIEILLYNSKQNIGASYIIYFVPPIASIFISHFIINLRQFQYGSSEATQVQQSNHWQTSQDQAASLQFTARIVDNMGAPLYHFTTTVNAHSF